MMAATSNVAPPCAPCMTFMLGPCDHYTGFAWGAAAAPLSYPPPAAPASAGERRGSPPPPLWLLHTPLEVDLGLPVLLGLLLLPLPRYPSRGFPHLVAQRKPLPLPPFTIPQGPGGRRQLPLWSPPPPPRRCSPLPHQPEGDALKNVDLI